MTHGICAARALDPSGTRVPRAPRKIFARPRTPHLHAEGNMYTEAALLGDFVVDDIKAWRANLR